MDATEEHGSVFSPPLLCNWWDGIIRPWATINLAKISVLGQAPLASTVTLGLLSTYVHYPPPPLLQITLDYDRLYRGNPKSF